MSANYTGIDEQIKRLPEDYQLLINQLSAKHYPIKLTKNVTTKNIILRFPSPHALEMDGLKETKSMHYAIDLTKYMEDGYSYDYGGRCLKYNAIFSMSQLLSMPSLDDRGYKNVQKKIQGFLDTATLVRDAKGNWIPKAPGKCTPLDELPADHVALQYLRSRGYEAKALVEQFNAAYCYEEHADADTYYKKLPYGFKFSPEGRIVFYMDMYGIRRGWQARLIELEFNNILHYWQPYEEKWVPIKYRKNEEMLPVDPAKDFKTPKYKTALGSKKTETFMGFDAAVDSGKDYTILVEGVLDAARLGIPAMSVQGKTLSDVQADLISDHFKRVFVIGDNDSSGKNLVEQVKEKMAAKSIACQEITIPPQYEDVGDTPKEVVIEILKDYGI